MKIRPDSPLRHKLLVAAALFGSLVTTAFTGQAAPEPLPSDVTRVPVALVKDSTIIGYEIIDGGAGYTSPPAVSVPGLNNVSAKVELSFGKMMEHNGAVASIAPR